MFRLFTSSPHARCSTRCTAGSRFRKPPLATNGCPTLAAETGVCVGHRDAAEHRGILLRCLSGCSDSCAQQADNERRRGNPRRGEPIVHFSPSIAISGLLAITELDARHARSRFASLDLGEAISDFCEVHRPVLEDTGLSLVIETSPTFVFSDRVLLQRLIGNLLDNALAHAGAGSRVSVSVSVTRSRGEAPVTVHDDGPGVPLPSEPAFSSGSSGSIAAGPGRDMGLASVWQTLSRGRTTAPSSRCPASGVW